MTPSPFISTPRVKITILLLATAVLLLALVATHLWQHATDATHGRPHPRPTPPPVPEDELPISCPEEGKQVQAQFHALFSYQALFGAIAAATESQRASDCPGEP